MAITPVTREEKILSGEDIQPRTRMEYFLKKASENGGESGLPEYTSADKGKFLGLGGADPVETEVVVVPEQTLTFAEYVTSGGEITVYLAPLPLDGVTNGAMYTATIDGVEMSSTAALNQITFGQGQFRIRQEIGVSTIPDGWYLNGRSVHAGDSITFSLKTVQSVTPSVTTVIVPEQTVTLEESSVGVWVKLFEEGGGVDFSFFENAKEGDTAVFTLNGTTTESVAANVYGEVLFPVGDYYVGYASMFEGTGVAALGEPTVKTITISGDSVKPKTVAKWVTPVFVLEKNFGASTVGESEEDYNALMSAYNEGAILLLKNTASNVGALRNVGAAFYINYDSENNVFTANIAWLEDGSVVYLAFGTYTIDPNATTNRRTEMCSVELSRQGITH